jgi:hypothetical protein
MKKLLLASFATLCLSGFAHAQPAVGVSISVGEPGFYGAIDIGNAPPPVLYSPQPVLVEPVPMGVAPLPPLYLHVPLGYRRDWRHHCAEFNACGRPVYFVQDNWYNRVYVPHYRQHHEYYEGRRAYEEQRPMSRGEERGRPHEEEHRR